MTSAEINTDHDFWQLHIKQWKASGLSQASYCRQHSLVKHQFRYWKRKFLTDHEPADLEPKAGFARVQVSAHVSTPFSPGLSLCFRDGTQITGIAQHNLTLIKQLIEVLR
jgi:transposase-like protein